MANGFDRLERFFTSKRKASQVAGESGSPVYQAAEPQFPSPSFIRPKANRMAAREEVRLRQATTRSPSVPDIHTSQRAPLSHGTIIGLSDGLYPSRHPLARSPSFGDRRPEPLITALRDFQFPKLSPSRNGEITPVSATLCHPDAPQLPSPRSRSPLQLDIPSLYRTDTPPSSDPEDNAYEVAALSAIKAGRIPSLPYGAPPTPGESPKLGPMPDSTLRMSKSFDALDKTLFRDIHLQLGESFDRTSLRRSSQSSETPSSHISYSSSILREPDFNEFLNLSDDDIAESTLESDFVDSLSESEPELPSMDLSISATQPLPSSLLTLSPPRASRPATAAAFEAARIAKRYDFDLVYVVNLWPDSSRPQTPVSRFERASHEDFANMPQTPLIGRLLAAHGLHHVPSPLQISSAVHTTILRSDGWVEYRNEDAGNNDLARGYASAFYTGQYARTVGESLSGPVSGVRLSEQIDRGIVFAAYRKPRVGETKLGRGLSQEELGELHREAEVLVEMLIDIHVASRLRRPPTPTSTADETGPMPVPLLEVS